jgi:hypothetical protein
MLDQWMAPRAGRTAEETRREALEDLMAAMLTLEEFQTNH